MSIPIIAEPADMGAPELCCFCRLPTRTWTLLSDRTMGEQVACCGACADQHHHNEVPTKRQWCDADRAIAGREGRMLP